MSSSDPLYNILEKHLFTSWIKDETSEELVTRVVAEYIVELMQTASIPVNVADFVEADLREEARDMLRKITYGFYDINEFRKKKGTSEKPPRR